MVTTAMMRWNRFGSLVLLLLVCSLSRGQTYDGSKSDLHVYLLIGQSNMAGRAEMSDEDQQTMSGVYLLDEDGDFEPASNPLNRYSTIRKPDAFLGLGPGYTFADGMLDALSHWTGEKSVGLVVNARGSTRISHWKPDSEEGYYDEAVARAKLAQKHGVLKGVLWHQGESNRDTLSYVSHLEEIVEALRSDLGDPSLPFVAGEIASDADFNTVLSFLPSMVPGTGLASSAFLSTHDGTHFDNASQKVLGFRYADAMSALPSSTTCLIRNVRTGKYLRGKPNGRLTLSSYGASWKKKWLFYAAEPGLYNIVCRKSDYGALRSTDHGVRLFDGSLPLTGASKQWSVSYISGGFFQFRNEHSGKLLSADGDSVVESSVDDESSEWEIVYQ